MNTAAIRERRRLTLARLPAAIQKHDILGFFKNFSIEPENISLDSYPRAGLAWVDMNSTEDATKAAAELNLAILWGKSILVSVMGKLDDELAKDAAGVGALQPVSSFNGDLNLSLIGVQRRTSRRHFRMLYQRLSKLLKRPAP